MTFDEAVGPAEYLPGTDSIVFDARIDNTVRTIIVPRRIVAPFAGADDTATLVGFVNRHRAQLLMVALTKVGVGMRQAWKSTRIDLTTADLAGL